jgi:CBS domain containing-hemolysin-like protein
MLIRCAVLACVVALGAFVASATGAAPTSADTDSLSAFETHFPPSVLFGIVMLLFLSAFFSGSETAFFSIHALRIRALREDGSRTGRLVAAMMEHPSQLLTTILAGNMIVNLLIGLLLGARGDAFFSEVIPSRTLAYVLSVTICTFVLVLSGEIVPKIFAVTIAETFARTAAYPMRLVDRLLTPIRWSCMRVTEMLFRAFRLHEMRAAPFITDDEFKSVLSDGEAQGVIEEDERQMIQGILEFTDAPVREILVPRPDVIGISAAATVGEALVLLRENDYSRMPAYQDDIDHIVGLLVVKDLLPMFTRGETDEPIKPLLRAPHYVPETMTIQQFVKDAQRRRSHLAIAVDEYGGTAGIVSLEDALEEVVGDIVDDDEHEPPNYTQLSEHVYQVEGGFPLDELSELIGVKVEDEEHETVAGFLMNLTDKIPEVGDAVEHAGVRFVVEATEGKRAESVRVHLLPAQQEEVS